jgi:hypothetical protein
MTGATTDAATEAGSAGKALRWNQAELLAVASAAPVVLQSPIIGAKLKHPLWGGVFSEFLRDECCPSAKQQ